MLFLWATVLDTLTGNRRRLTQEAKLCVCGHRQPCFFIFVAQNTTRTNFFPFSSKRHRGHEFLVFKQEISISNTKAPERLIKPGGFHALETGCSGHSTNNSIGLFSRVVSAHVISINIFQYPHIISAITAGLEEGKDTHFSCLKTKQGFLFGTLVVLASDSWIKDQCHYQPANISLGNLKYLLNPNFQRVPGKNSFSLANSVHPNFKAGKQSPSICFTLQILGARTLKG